MYNRLFDFLDDIKSDFIEESNKEHPEWPRVIEDAAEKGRAKLLKYYRKINNKYSYLFNYTTILDLI